MFTHVHIQNLKQYPDRQVTIKGWVAGKTAVGGAFYLDVRDGTGTVRCVVAPNIFTPEHWTLVEKLSQESSVTVTGKTGADDSKGMEIRVSALEIHWMAPPLPQTINAKENRHLWMRTPEGQATLRIRNAAQKAISDYFDWSGFTRVDSPVLVGKSQWGKGGALKLDKPDFELARSPEYFLRSAAMALGKVYASGPVFGAFGVPGSKAVEYESWSIDAEIAFVDLDDVMLVAEDFLSYLVHRLSTEQAAELRTLSRNPVPLNFVKKPFPRHTPAEANDIIARRAHDRPLFIHRLDSARAPWSTRRDPKDPKVALAFGIVAPEGFGVIGAGAEREPDPKVLEKQIKAAGLKPEPFRDYLEAGRYGAAPLAGFSLDLGKFLGWLTGK